MKRSLNPCDDQNKRSVPPEPAVGVNHGEDIGGNDCEDNDGSDDEVDHEEDDDQDGDGDDEDADGEIEALPRILFHFANEILRDEAKATDSQQLTRALNALEKCKSTLFAMDEELRKIHKKSLGRNDGKVPPGSKSVVRSLDDDRFLLSLCCIARANIFERENDCLGAIGSLKEALVWFPRSIQGGCGLAKLLKTQATTSSDLTQVETLLRKCVTATLQLQEEVSNYSRASVTAGKWLWY